MHNYISLYYKFCSLLFGNLFVHFEFINTGQDISKQVRTVVYAALAATGVLGTLLIIALRRPPPKDDDDSTVNGYELFCLVCFILDEIQQCIENYIVF